MAESINVNIRMDKEIKEEADAFFNALGLNMTSAINIFVRQSLRQGKIPFELSLVPNTETLKAMQEAEEISKTGKSRFTSTEDMLKELKKDASS